MHTVAGVGQSAFKALGHPAKEGFDRAFRRRCVRRRLLGDDAEPIYQNLPCTLGREDLAPVMEDDGWFAVTGPGMFASIDSDQAIFWLQCLLHQAHIFLFLEGTEGEDCA